LFDLPTVEDVRAAASRIGSRIHRTPLLSSRFLGEAHGARVHLKAENLQRAGSFKIRGALNALLRAQEDGRIGAAGVITYSSGNHGQAVALAARLLGFPALVVVPEDIARVKLAALAGYGARVHAAGKSSEDRFVAAHRLAEETGALIIPPYDHPDVIAGQGTIALEVLAELPDAGAIVVPVGGGGLIAGIAIAAKGLKPGIRIHGVEPEDSNDLALSLAAGKRVKIPPPATVADGLRAVTPGELTFAAARRHVDAVWCVSDASILEAARIILERAKLLAEPSGAVSAAGYLRHGSGLRGEDVVLILSGGNADLPRAQGPS
jgi:threonine dehydratase